MSPSKIKPKTLKSGPKDTTKPWLKLPVKPAGSLKRRVRMTMGDEVIELTPNVRELSRSMALDEAATITIDVADPAGDLASLELLDADEDMLLDGIDIRWGQVWWRIARLERTDDGWSITAEDRTAGLIRAHNRAMKASRDDMTRAAFVYQLVNAVKFDGGIAAYIPELGDKQKIRKAEKPADEVSGWTAEKATAKSSGSSYGWGKAAGKVKVDHHTANSTQLKCLNLVLAEAAKLGASRRVMIAVVMCVSGESSAGVNVGGNSIAPDVRGPFQQRTYAQSGWTLSVRSALDATESCKRFLLGGDRGAPGWKQKHGSLHSAGGNLGEMVDQVQIAGAAKYYSGFEPEATTTVDLWLDRNKGATSTSTGDRTKTEYYRGVFQFKTSDSDQNANWWDATGQLAADVKWHRWVAGNVFGFASDDELIRGTPVLYLSRDQDWVHDLKWTWDVRREAAELTTVVQLEDEWQLLPGMVVMVDDDAAVDGRWIVDQIDDTPIGATSTTQLRWRRRNAKSIEPAAPIEQKTTTIKAKRDGKTYGGATKASESAKAVYDEAVRISQLDLSYSWGGGHERAGYPSSHSRSSTGGPVVLGYDCSGYTVACLAAANWGFRKGGPTAASGALASWGKPGRGKYVTVWASNVHVFIEFHGMGKFRRADTSPQASDGAIVYGPHVRTGTHTTIGFTPRHWPGS